MSENLTLLGLVALLGLGIAPCAAAPFDQELYDSKARTYSPEESMATIEMQDGYSLELVAAQDNSS